MSFQDINLKDLTINTLKEFKEKHSLMMLHNPGGELFQAEDGLCLDVQSINVLTVIYDNLSEKNQARFNDIIHSEYKFANILDKMWGWVK